MHYTRYAKAARMRIWRALVVSVLPEDRSVLSFPGHSGASLRAVTLLRLGTGRTHRQEI